jgi:ankyrin repeat protein
MTRFSDQPRLLESSRHGESVLGRALANDQTAIAELLVRCGADGNTLYADGCSELHRQAWVGRCRAVEFLLRSGASPTIVVSDSGHPLFGRTPPTDMAAVGGHVECVEILIRGRTDSAAEFSLAVAEACAGDDTRLSMFRGRRDLLDLGCPLVQVILRGKFEVASSLNDLGASPAAGPIVAATLRSNGECVDLNKKMLQHGADRNAALRNGGA